MKPTTEQCEEATAVHAKWMSNNDETPYTRLRLERLLAGGKRHDHAVLRDETGETLRAELLAELCDGPNFAHEKRNAFLNLHGEDPFAPITRNTLYAYEEAAEALAEAIIEAYGIPDAARRVEPDQEEPT